jgi:hypothetical protein
MNDRIIVAVFQEEIMGSDHCLFGWADPPTLAHLSLPAPFICVNPVVQVSRCLFFPFDLRKALDDEIVKIHGY